MANPQGPGKPCRRLWATASDACVPLSASLPWGFADPACTEPALALGPPLDPASFAPATVEIW